MGQGGGMPGGGNEWLTALKNALMQRQGGGMSPFTQPMQGQMPMGNQGMVPPMGNTPPVMPPKMDRYPAKVDRYPGGQAPFLPPRTIGPTTYNQFTPGGGKPGNVYQGGNVGGMNPFLQRR